MANKGLNPKWRIFAERVCAGSSLTDAYYAAGYHPVNRFTAQRLASRLRHHPKVSAYLSTIRQAAKATARAATIRRIQEKRDLLARLIRTGADSVDADSDLATYRRVFKSGSTSVRLPCKLTALRLDAKLAGHFRPPARSAGIKNAKNHNKTHHFPPAAEPAVPTSVLADAPRIPIVPR